MFRALETRIRYALIFYYYLIIGINIFTVFKSTRKSLYYIIIIFVHCVQLFSTIVS